MLLIPHCIQNSQCKIRITINPENCIKCGKCKIKEILEIKKLYSIRLFIATGGTLARKVIKEIKPKALLAVACERDLISGIMDIFPLPIVGILNKRLNGPCINTDVSIEELKRKIRKFLKVE